MKTAPKLLNIGVEGFTENERRRIRLQNLLAIIAATTSTGYLIFYLTLSSTVPAIINITVIVLYLFTFALTHKKHHRLAKIWVLAVHMVHLAVLTLVVFPKEVGFHYYYFSFPAVVFLLFEYRQMAEKLILAGIAFVLFFICELVEAPEPYLQLSPSVNRALFISSLSTVFLGILIVVYIFTRYIKKHEDEQEDLIQQLRKALSEVKTLRGFLPICSSCKKIRDDKGYWNQIELYIRDRSEAEFSHSICPDCADKYYPEFDLFDKDL